MSVLLAEATVNIKADTSKIGVDAERGMKSQSGLFSKIGAVTGGILGAQMVNAAGRAIKSIFRTGVQEAKDASAGTAQLAAGIKSTKNAADVSVKSLLDRAGAIQAMTGQTDDSIVSAQSLLLTFTGISNAGPEKIFDRTTVAAANMAARMGGDASSNAMLLGKALNSPADGLARLTKVGVTFTDAQKDLVKQMVATGDTAGAQSIILDELEKEFGGSAEAAGKSLPGVLERIRRGYEDVTQTVTERFIPLVLPSLQWLADKAGGAGDATSAFFDGLESRFGKLNLGKIVELVTTFSPLANILKVLQVVGPEVGAALLPVLQQMGEKLAPLAPLIAESLGNAVVTLAPSITQLLIALLPLLPVITDLAVLALPPLIDALNFMLPLISDGISLQAGFYESFGLLFGLISGDTSLAGFVDGLRKIKGPFGDITRMTTDLGTNLAHFFLDVGRNAGLVGKTIGGAFAGVGRAVGGAFANVVGFVKGGINGVISLVNTAIGALNRLKVNVPSWVPGIGGQSFGLSLPRIPMLARGTNFAPDMFIAGERGPELITGAKGATVRPYDVTKDMLAKGGDEGGLTVNGNIVLDASNVSDFMRIVEMIKALKQTARAGRGLTPVMGG